MERLDRLIDLFSTLEKTYVVNELILLKKDIEVEILKAEINQIKVVKESIKNIYNDWSD